LATVIIDAIPILGWFAWTTSISIFVLGKKIQSVVPGAEAGVTKPNL